VSHNPVWYKKETLPAAVGAWIFDEGAKENDVYGPYFENEAYMLAKVDTLAMLPDSVKARHILIRVNTQEEVLTAQKLADSLKTVIEKGGDFAALALQYSTDQGSAVKGGDLGWFGRGMMVKPFEDAAFNNDKNEVSVAMSQFGIHVIQTTDKGKPTLQAQVAFLVRNVTSSTRTEQDIYAQASKFAIDNDSQEKFNKAVVEQKLSKKVATVRESDLNIVGLQNARVLVRSAYEGEVGNVLKTSQESPIFELGNNFVIAVLTKATEEGEATFEDARTQVELAVRKQKKVELLSKKASDAAQGKSDLYAIASALNTSVRTAENVDFNTFSVPGLGLEPALVGTVTAMGAGKISKPVEGNNGVYLAKVVTETPIPGVDAKMEQTRLSQNVFYKASSQAFESQRKKAEITDKRAKFY
jgi:peptidyl-prolyl cis-trans isomerase D